MALDLMHVQLFHCQIIKDLLKMLLFFGVNNSLLVHVDNIRKYILIFGKNRTGELDDTTEAKCSVNITRSRKKICWSLHCNEGNSFLYANCVKIYWFKEKCSEIILYPLCLGNISKCLLTDSVKKHGKMDKCLIFLLIVE